MIRAALILMLFMAVTSAQARNPPDLVPDGWSRVPSSGNPNTVGFVSPDGRAHLTLGRSRADRENPGREMDKITHRPGEVVTYQRRGRSWIVVSGYREGEIFYRRVNLACSGTRWHTIEMRYPREDKRRMDADVTAISHGLTQYGNACPSRSARD
jgi:hypothetical protein